MLNTTSVPQSILDRPQKEPGELPCILLDKQDINCKTKVIYLVTIVSQSVDLGQNNNPNTTPTKDYENVRVVVYLRGVQRGCAEEGERGSTPTG